MNNCSILERKKIIRYISLALLLAAHLNSWCSLTISTNEKLPVEVNTYLNKTLILRHQTSFRVQ